MLRSLYCLLSFPHHRRYAPFPHSAVSYARMLASAGCKRLYTAHSHNFPFLYARPRQQCQPRRSLVVGLRHSDVTVFFSFSASKRQPSITLYMVWHSSNFLRHSVISSSIFSLFCLLIM